MRNGRNDGCLAKSFSFPIPCAYFSTLLSFLSSTLILSTTPVSRNGHRRNKQRERDLSVFDPLRLISEEAAILIDSLPGYRTWSVGLFLPSQVQLQSRAAYFRLVLSGTLLTDLRNAILSLTCCVLLLLTCFCCCCAVRRLVASVRIGCLARVACSAQRRFAWFTSLALRAPSPCLLYFN